jgi:hypothetical protein
MGRGIRSPQGILLVAVGSEPTEWYVAHPIPAGDLVSSRGFGTHGMVRGAPDPRPGC